MPQLRKLSQRRRQLTSQRRKETKTSGPSCCAATKASAVAKPTTKAKSSSSSSDDSSSVPRVASSTIHLQRTKPVRRSKCADHTRHRQLSRRFTVSCRDGSGKCAISAMCDRAVHSGRKNNYLVCAKHGPPLCVIKHYSHTKVRVCVLAIEHTLWP